MVLVLVLVMLVVLDGAGDGDDMPLVANRCPVLGGAIKLKWYIIYFLKLYTKVFLYAIFLRLTLLHLSMSIFLHSFKGR